MDVNEYRRRNPRCRTCQHAKEGCYEWWCAAKRIYHRGQWLQRTKLKGILCGMYIPKEEKE